MKKYQGQFLLLCLLLLITLKVGSAAAETNDENQATAITTGSVLTVKIEKGLAEKELFNSETENSNRIDYSIRLGSYDSCVSSVDNLFPKDRELGRVTRSSSVNYDLRFPIQDAVLESFKFDASLIRFRLAYQKPDGSEGVWESEIEPFGVYFFPPGSGAEPTVEYPETGFVTRDSLEIVYYGMYSSENGVIFRLYFLGDQYSESACYTAARRENDEDRTIFAQTCTDHIEGKNALRKMNYFEYSFAAPEIVPESRTESLDITFENPTLIGKFIQSDGSVAERKVVFGKDLSVRFYAEYDFSYNNRCLDYEIE